MMQSLHHGHRLVIQNLHQLSIHLSMEPPLMTPEAFLQQVAWPKVQPSCVVGKGGGVTPLAWVVMELMMIMLRTSMLLRKLGIQGPHRIGAYFDKDFSLIFLVFGYCLSLCFLVCKLPYRGLERRIGAIP